MNQPIRRVRVHVVCSGHEHEVCVPVDRGLPEELLCNHPSHGGFGGGGTGCRLPAHLEELVDRELRDSFQESKRRGYVLVRAA